MNPMHVILGLRQVDASLIIDIQIMENMEERGFLQISVFVECSCISKHELVLWMYTQK